MSEAEATSHPIVDSSASGVEALLESHELLALATEAAQAGWGTWDLRTGESDWDERGKQIMGFADESEAETAEGWLNRVHPEDRPEVEAHLARCIAKDLDFGLDFRIIRADGQTRNIRATGRFKKAEDGTALRAIGLVMDVTEGKRAEEESRESGQFVRQLLRHFPNGSVNVFDRALRYVLAEGQGLAQVGLSSEVLAGKSLDEVFSKEAVDFVKPYYRRAFAGEAVQFELPVAHDVYSINATPLQYGEDGEVRTIIAVAQNITEREQMEEDLRESEERFRAIVSQATAGIARADLSGRLEFVNSRMCELLGYPEAELIGRSIRELTHPDDIQEHIRLFRRLATEGTPFLLEKRLLRKDGSTIWVNISVSAIRDAAGKPRSAGAVVLDVTERKLAAEALVASEARFRTLVENIRDYAIFMLDADGVVTGWPEGARQVKGYAAEEVIGRHVSMFYAPEEVTAGEPEQELAQAAEEGRAEREAWRVRKDGERIFVNEIATAVHDDEGRLLGFTKISRDLTERRRAEEALKESEERLQRAIAIETVGVIFIKANRQITEANDAFLRMSGYSREDLAEGKLRWDVMTPPEWMPRSLEAVEELKTTGRTTPYEKEYIRKDGSRWWGLFAATSLGAEEEVVEFIIDVTGRKRAEAERERFIAHELTARAQAEERRRLSRALHDRVAHDIALVHQSLELHEVFKMKDPESAAAKMQLARRIVKEALESTRDLSMELREPQVRRGLEAALANLLRDLVPPTVESSLSVEGDEALVSPEIRSQLFLILREAIRNAVAHSGAAHVAVEVDIGQERVVGRVEDDGRGFDPDEVRTAGSGGLRAMSERATLVGATFDLFSAPGRGTTIKVYIPLGEA